MTQVTGSIYQRTNVRRAASASSSLVLTLDVGVIFSGTLLKAGTEQWIKLETINGMPVTDEQYIASWIVNYKEVKPTEPADDDPFVMAELTTKSGHVFVYDMTPKN